MSRLDLRKDPSMPPSLRLELALHLARWPPWSEGATDSPENTPSPSDHSIDIKCKCYAAGGTSTSALSPPGGPVPITTSTKGEDDE